MCVLKCEWNRSGDWFILVSLTEKRNIFCSKRDHKWKKLSHFYSRTSNCFPINISLHTQWKKNLNFNFKTFTKLYDEDVFDKIRTPQTHNLSALSLRYTPQKLIAIEINCNPFQFQKLWYKHVNNCN